MKPTSSFDDNDEVNLWLENDSSNTDGFTYDGMINDDFSLF
jgi:hypothetical protein